MNISKILDKTWMNYWWVILFICILASCSAVKIPKPPVTSIRVVMDNNYPPYAFLDDDGNMQGILVDQWKLWEKRTGIKVEITGLPWDQALGRMKDGEFDVIDTIFYTDERAEIFDFTKPYAKIDVLIFFPNSVSGIVDAGDLKGFRVAVKAGDANAEYLLNQGVTNLAYYNSYEEIIQAASRKDEAIFVIDEPPALYFLQKYNIQKDFNSSEPLYSGEFHRAVRKGNSAILELVNTGFSKISKREYQTINNRWFGRQYPSNLDQIIYYLGIGIALTILIISILVIFNRSLQKRVLERTKELEEALSNLKNSETRFRDSIEFLPIPISIADQQGNILTVNNKFTENYGYTLEDMPTIPAWMLLAYPDPERREKVLAQWARDVAIARRNETITPLREYDITSKDGQLHNTEILMRPVKNLWVASFVDITERVHTENILRENKYFIESVVNTTPELVYIYDLVERRNIYTNRELVHTLGYSPEQVRNMGTNVFTLLLHPDDAAAVSEHHKKMLFVKDEVLELDYRMKDSKGVWHWLHSRDKAFSRNTDGSVKQIIGTASDITERKEMEKNLAESYDTTLEGWARALELRDKETEGHSRRVTEATLKVARAMGISEEELTHIRRGAILHDIGKMGIPDEILRKQGSLTQDEREIVNHHPEVAYNLLSGIPYLKKALEIPYCHHEKWDGTGYPRGLRGNEIPLTARIFAVADVWDALSYDRPYRNAWDKDKVIQHLRDESGKHFDTKIVQTFIELLERGEI